ncbi:NUDIX domain-containing protein [Embleya sp. NPDC059237]|uniref:NUDIX domain-containing protein n=1 Tax=Embleya sp. NPDC059237 TaxID=3346784 RepID=UPI003680C8AB
MTTALLLCLPSGKVEPGEDVVTAAVRETGAGVSGTRASAVFGRLESDGDSLRWVLGRSHTVR